MPRLDWIGHKAVENHHRQVPFHLLKEVPELSVGDPDSGNASTPLSTSFSTSLSAGLLAEGDNLLALKALLPYYAGQVTYSSSIRCAAPAMKNGYIMIM